MLNTLLGVVLGIVVYIGFRIFSPEEEKLLSTIFVVEWENYNKKVKFHGDKKVRQHLKDANNHEKSN